MAMSQGLFTGRLGLALLLAGLLTLAVGCGDRKPLPKESQAGKSGSGTGKTPPAEAKTAEEFAQTFLNAVNTGQAKPEMLTTEFKKVIAEPVFQSDDEKGFSQVAAESWLKKFEGKTPTKTPSAGLQLGKAVGFVIPGQPSAVLRVVQDDSGWKADWLSVADVGITASPGEAGDPASSFAAIAFLHAVVSEQHALAAGMLAAEFRQQLAPPFEADQKRGYNRGILASKLNGLRDSATGFNLSEAKPDQAKASLLGESTDKPLTLKLANGSRPWDKLIDGF